MSEGKSTQRNFQLYELNIMKPLGMVYNIELFWDFETDTIYGFEGLNFRWFHTPVFCMEFSPNTIMCGAKQIQHVFVAGRYAGGGVTLLVIQRLVSLGMIIIAESLCQTWAQITCKRIASNNFEQVVYVCDADELKHGKLGRVYDGDNIPDDEIWNEKNDNHQKFLIVMLKSAVSKYQ